MKGKRPSVEIVAGSQLPSIVADEIVAAIGDVIADRASCSMVLSGGSTPGAIYRMLSRPPRVSEVEWDHLRIYFGDERWVPKDDNQSNYRMASETLLSHLRNPSPQIFSVDTSLGSPDESAEAYAGTIRKKESLQNGGLPEFDIVLLGIGVDGHFASIFPGSASLSSELFSGKDSVCLVEPHPRDGSTRISLSPSTLLSARNIYVIVKGDKKADIVQRVLEGNDSPTDVPARILVQARGKVQWFVDSSAAQQLSADFR